MEEADIQSKQAEGFFSFLWLLPVEEVLLSVLEPSQTLPLTVPQKPGMDAELLYALSAEDIC